MTRTPRIIAALAALISAGLLFTLGAAMATPPVIDDAKAACIIGEQADGYLGIKDQSAASTELRREMNSINIQRKAAYANLAQKNGVSVEVAAQVTAEKLIERAPAGECYRDANGTWQTKR